MNNLVTLFGERYLVMYGCAVASCTWLMEEYFVESSGEIPNRQLKALNHFLSTV